MLVHRLVKARHAATALDGEGARRVGGRWNPPGIPVVYGSSSLSLAVLELLAHTDPGNLPADLVALRIQIPDGVPWARWLPEDLPGDWRLETGKATLHGLGLEWVRAGATGVLVVPSVLVPAETNILINPAHPDAARIQVQAREPFTLDPRLAQVG